jgi:hypothetical protein
MKNRFIILIICSLSFSNFILSQNSSAERERLEAQKKSVQQKPKPLVTPIIPAYSVDTEIDGVMIDYRVFKHYTLEQINEMPKQKKEQINYLFANSFSLADNACKISKKEIDIFEYNQFRKLNEDVTVYYKASPTCKTMITLISWNKFEEIKLKMNSK